MMIDADESKPLEYSVYYVLVGEAYDHSNPKGNKFYNVL
jgi:hypothetical protein